MKSLDNITTKSGKNLVKEFIKTLEKPEHISSGNISRLSQELCANGSYGKSYKGFQENPQAVADELGKIVETTPWQKTYKRFWYS